jgi:hypothetical protein
MWDGERKDDGWKCKGGKLDPIICYPSPHGKQLVSDTCYDNDNARLRLQIEHLSLFLSSDREKGGTEACFPLLPGQVQWLTT